MRFTSRPVEPIFVVFGLLKSIFSQLVVSERRDVKLSITFSNDAQRFQFNIPQPAVFCYASLTGHLSFRDVLRRGIWIYFPKSSRRLVACPSDRMRRFVRGYGDSIRPLS